MFELTMLKYCPFHGDALPCKTCQGAEHDALVDMSLAYIACQQVNKANSGRVAASITHLYHTLEASEKFLHDFQETMVGAGKAKKEGILQAGDTIKDINKQIAELSMHVYLARSKIGQLANPQ
jgi:hypothetical protein